MSAKVVDACALAALLFDEPEGPDVEQLLAGAELHAPWLLKFELANICWKKIRRGEDEVKLYSGLAGIAKSDIQFDDVDAVAITELAIETGLTAYDASYLWLARTLSADLVTLDAKLSAAAGSS